MLRFWIVWLWVMSDWAYEEHYWLQVEESEFYYKLLSRPENQE